VSGKVQVTIASAPDRETTYAELSCDGEEWGMVSDGDGPLVLELYPRSNGQAWILDYEEDLRALQYAQRRLSGDGPESADAVLDARSA